MIKALLVGLWVTIVALAATYGGATWLAAALTQKDNGKKEVERELLKARGISVPMIAEGAVQGYVVAHLAFTVDTKAAKQLPLAPEAFILDEAFKAIYGTNQVDFRDLKKQDLVALSEAIRDKINARFGKDFVAEVLFEELNYVPSDEVRGGR